MTPETAATIQRLVRDGATVVGPKPTASPSLAGYPASDEKLRAIAEEVWGKVDGREIKRRSYGKGTVYHGVTLAEVIADLGLTPAFRVEDNPHLAWSVAGTSGPTARSMGKAGGILFTHRAAADHEVFFLTNTNDGTATFTASLRTSGRQPELWNAATGEIRPAAAFTQHDGRTRIPLTLAPSESIFIVFTTPIAPTPQAPQAPTPPPAKPSPPSTDHGPCASTARARPPKPHSPI
jgi:hypothetical protein